MCEFYEFYSEESNNGLRYDYGFVSASERGYYVYFEAAPEYLEEFTSYDYLGRYGFAVGFYPLDEDAPNTAIIDFKIGATICAIIKDFIEKHDKVIILYHCDASDGKQHKRKNLFDGWEKRYGQETSLFKDHVKLKIVKSDGSEHFEYLGYFALCDAAEVAIITLEFNRFAVEKATSMKDPV